MITHLIYMGFFSWGILFSHPADYTPVCATELGRVTQLAPEFEKRGVKMIALSINSPAPSLTMAGSKILIKAY